MVAVVTALTRRQILAGAAATAAVAAMPAAAIAEIEQAAEPVTYLDPAVMAWTSGRVYRPRELVTIAGRFHCVLFSHVAEDEPSTRYMSRPLYIHDDGRFVEEDE
jgi:hypothetical protein